MSFGVKYRLRNKDLSFDLWRTLSEYASLMEEGVRVMRVLMTRVVSYEELRESFHQAIQSVVDAD
eukprot:49412-Eustigmatos_ZCMA.PRE.1